MTNRVPPSSRPPSRTGTAQSAQQASRVRRPKPAQEKPKPVKLGGAAAETSESPEVGLWGGKDYDKSLAEVSLKEIEGYAHEQAAADEAHSDAAKEHTVELHEQAEREDGKPKWSPTEKSSAPRPDKAQQQAPPKQAGQAQQQQQAGQVKKPPGQPAGPAETKAASLASTSFTNLAPVREVATNKLQGTMARAERPPDAFTLLREAKEKGSLFTEDALREGHSEDKDDPELAAAVEECIRLCFGVRGILRIGPGRNDQAEPIIVVVASTGFSEGSLSKVPEKVHRFATLLAIPFDLLPLRRER